MPCPKYTSLPIGKAEKGNKYTDCYSGYARSPKRKVDADEVVLPDEVWGHCDGVHMKENYSVYYVVEYVHGLLALMKL